MSGAPDGSRVGTHFGPYYLKRLIGAGGFGEVYEAEDTVKERIVALKLLREATSKDPVFRERMKREAHAAGRLQEPHVVPIHDYGEIDGLLYVDMRLIDGVDLHTLLEKSGPLPPARAVAIIRQVAAALDAAHAAGLMHRDVKPENVLITRDDFAYLVDFGLATAASDERLTQMGTMVGTFSYMAPERLRNKELTYRADIYSLACVLHECLTGARPYRADSLSGLITAHLTAPVPRPSEVRTGIPAAFDWVIACGMAKDPEDRYASAGDLANAALDALTAADKEHAARILERSEEATLPTGPTQPPATQPYRPPPPTNRPTPAPAAGFPPGAPLTGAPSGPLRSTAGSGPIQRFAGTGCSGGQGAYASGPQQVSAPPPWTSSPSLPSPGPRPRTRTSWLIGGAMAAAAVLAVVLILFATGVLPPGADGPTPAPPTSPVPPSGYTADDDTLIGYLAKPGYDRTVCDPQHPPKDNALSMLKCDALSGGPNSATFYLYADQSALDDAFKSVISNATLQTCPDGTSSPGKWHYTKDPTATAGQLACGMDGGDAVVMWTDDSKDFVAVVRDSSLSDLFTWWQEKS
ncbi:MAG: serine/threonine-protein kinase [Candidatus Sericytochromatia bacterium]